MMRARSMQLAGVAAIAAALLASAPAPAAHAQAGASAPDVRSVPPIVMLLVDTSASMEKKTDCVCTTPACEECMPMCTDPAEDERNKWATVLEALTGEWEDFDCERKVRSGGMFVGAMDQGMKPDHFEPPIGSPQLNNGILDVYRDRVKFGLMTFDGVSTFTDLSTDLLPQRLFEMRLDDNVRAPGDFSYGGPKAFSFPGCGEDHMLDNGARNENADLGRLVSVGSDAASDREVINQTIQSVLMDARPFGGTPIAGMLDDVQFFLNNHRDVKPVTVPGGAGDAFASCRTRYVVLLTDGAPSGDMRGPPVNCDSEGFECPYELPEEIAAQMCQFSGSQGGCTGKVDGVFAVGFDVDPPPDADPSDIEKAEEVRRQLNAIAEAGGTVALAEQLVDEGVIERSELAEPGEDLGALFANDLETLVTVLAAALDQAQPGTTTRTVPAFATSALGADEQGQSQLNTGFRMGKHGEPWEGVLERRRFECNESFEPEPQPITREDKFHEVLNDRSSQRNLFTVVPRDLANLNGHLAGEDTGIAPIGAGGNPRSSNNGGGPGGKPNQCNSRNTGGGGGGNNGGGNQGGGNNNTGSPDETGLQLTDFDTGNIRLEPEAFGVSTDTEANEIIDWVHGGGTSERPDVRLGDIYHSSPVVVGPPQQDVPDESFNQFRQRPEVANRPTVVYVGSNDGVLHAFAVEDADITSGPHAGTSVKAGEELWGFVPPMLLPKLKSAKNSHQWMVDGTPVVREIFFSRGPGAPANGEIYHTVLVVGMRGGGNGYIALDVTDPFEPEFLFQFAHPEMGATYGQAGLGQILVDTTEGLRERGFVFLPGGKGNDLTTELCGAPTVEDDGRLSKPLGCPSQGKGRPPANEGTLNARENQRCWDTTGRQLFFVDLASGELIRQLDDQVFNAPLSGSASLYPGETGQVATRVFITDADGMIWRIDVSSAQMADWDADPLFDMFFDADAVDGQPGYFPPIITTNPEGEVVVLQGTGNVDHLDGLAANRVVSVTEKLTFRDDGSVESVEAEPNWIIRLDDGEQVTGPLELFNGDVFFATFRSSSDSLDACQFGDAFIWGTHFIDTEEGSDQPDPRLPTDDPDEFDLKRGPFENEIIMGLAVNQRPTCTDIRQVSETDPFLGPRSFQEAAQAGGGQFELVALSSQGETRGVGAEVAEVRLELPSPESFTEAQSFAGTID